jgi:DNA polymerase III epsilon subunit-like protein
MKHVMLDLETLGTVPGASVISIGAVQFDLDGRMGETFQKNISAASCREIGLVEDPNTIAWWAKQSEEAQSRVVKDTQPVGAVVSAFSSWFLRNGCEFVWGHGSTFDVTLWEAVCRRLGVGVPWKFYNVRDTRTIFHVMGLDIRTMNRVGVHHDALDDAKFQVACVAEALKSLRPKAAPAGIFE